MVHSVDWERSPDQCPRLLRRTANQHGSCCQWSFVGPSGVRKLNLMRTPGDNALLAFELRGDRIKGMTPFPYLERAAAVRAAQQAVIAAACGLPHHKRDEKTRAAVDAARNKYSAAIAAAYHPDFWIVLEKLKANEVADIDVAIDFLEADPLYFRSGYLKGRLARLLRPSQLSETQARRLNRVILNIVQRRNTYEFREFCRLAYRLCNSCLCDELNNLARSSNLAEARRAKWMLMSIRARRFRSLKHFATAQRFRYP